MQKPINLNETIQKIKAAGANKVRVVPMPGESVHDGLHQIEVRQDGAWCVITEGIPQAAANEIITRATSRVICG